MYKLLIRINKKLNTYISILANRQQQIIEMG